MGKATGKINLETFSDLKAPTQYFWFEPNSSATVGGGAHITNISEPEFIAESAKWDDSSPEYDPFAGGTNLLMESAEGSAGLKVRDGSFTLMDLDSDSLDFNIIENNSKKQVASFGENTTIGEVASDKYNILINNTTGISLRDNETTRLNITNQRLAGYINNKEVFEIGYIKGQYKHLLEHTFSDTDFVFTDVTSGGTTTTYQQAIYTFEAPEGTTFPHVGYLADDKDYRILLKIYFKGYEETPVIYEDNAYKYPPDPEYPDDIIADHWPIFMSVWNTKAGWGGKQLPKGQTYIIIAPESYSGNDYTSIKVTINAICGNTLATNVPVERAEVYIGWDAENPLSSQSYFTIGQRSKIFPRGTYSAAFGNNTVARGSYSLAEGADTTSLGLYSHSEGNSTLALGEASHTEGLETQARANQSHTEGAGTIAEGLASHAEGNRTKASGQASHAEGVDTTASGLQSHAEGLKTSASSQASHSEGSSTLASGSGSHAEGAGTKATNSSAHSEGRETEANGQNSHAEGYKSKTTSNGTHGHAEGNECKVDGEAGHAEGYKTIAEEYSHAEGSETWATHTSHAEGYKTQAFGGLGAHAGGANSTANGEASFAHGYGVKADKDNGFVIGSYNKLDPGMTGATDVANYLFIIGNGTGNSTANRSNALTVDWDGNLTLKDHDSPVGTIVENGNPSSYSYTYSSGSSDWEFPAASSGNAILLTPGVWSITAYARLTGLTASRQYGVCVGTSTTNTASDFTARPVTRNIVHSSTTSPMNLQSTMTLEVTANTYVRTGIFHGDKVTIGNSIANNIYTKALRIV